MYLNNFGLRVVESQVTGSSWRRSGYQVPPSLVLENERVDGQWAMGMHEALCEWVQKYF